MDLFYNWEQKAQRYFHIPSDARTATQYLTNSAFSEKWTSYSSLKEDEHKAYFQLQRDWFLELYGFESEDALRQELVDCRVILDAGCGVGFKSAWLAELAPHASVIGVDYSDAITVGHRKYHNLENLFFAKGDIADLKLDAGSVDFVVCDQVIMHTQNPDATLLELSRVIKQSGSICCYWYRKKALPRELLDEHFRHGNLSMNSDELWSLSKDLTKLGQLLTDLKIETEFPDIPGLGIKGGKMDLQRFIYWNFVKCFWNPDLGFSNSVHTNFDWYSPANAKRYSEEEVKADVKNAHLEPIFFHKEEACYSGRFKKADQERSNIRELP